MSTLLHKPTKLRERDPAINGLANYIGDQPIGNIPTCGVYCVKLDISSWTKISDHCGKLEFFEFPKKHAS